MTTMNRIVMHHSGGGYTPGAADLKAYHTVTNSLGVLTYGNFPISANAAGTKLVTGQYAAHTKNLNTGSIGMAVAAMANGKWAKPYASYPPTEKQMLGFLKDVAKNALAYNIEPDRRFILSHAEVEPTLGVKQANKWDFDYDPFKLLDDRDPVLIGDDLRYRIAGYMADLKGSVTVIEQPSVFPVKAVLHQGSIGADVRTLQTKLSLVVDGIFGPKTRTAVIAFQKKNELLPDGIVGPLTWAVLLSK